MGCSGSRHSPPSAPPMATTATSNNKSDPYRSLSTYSRGFKVDEVLRDCIVEELCVDTSEPSSSDMKASSDDSSLPKYQLIHHCKVRYVCVSCDSVV